jgi:phosphohistidine phosphatase
VKTLLILRHAKAQPDAPHGDHARELNKRGRRDAAAIGAYLRSTIGTPDAIVTSDAARARQTADLAADELGDTLPPVLDPRIYTADLETLLEVVRGLPDNADSVVLVGHNPGFEELAAALAAIDLDEVRLPTAAVARVDFDVARWSDVGPGSAVWRGVSKPSPTS